MSSTPNNSKKSNVKEDIPDQPISATEQGKLNAVRDLLFGQNVQEYRDEFKDLKEMINTEQKERQQHLAEVRSEVMSRLDKLDQKLEKTNQELLNKLNQLAKTDKETLSELLKDMAEKLTS